MTDTQEIPFIYSTYNGPVGVGEAMKLGPDTELITGISFERMHLGNMKFARMYVPEGIPNGAMTFTPESLRSLATWIEEVD